MTSDEVTKPEEDRNRAADTSGLRHFVTSSPRHSLPIGVFDSGVGGLTVLRALRARLPCEDFVYLGDTARLPYGTKSAESVTRYSLQAADSLVRSGIKYLVIACNTASSVALSSLRARYAPLPVIGVIEPGAQAACDASRTGHIAVIATEGTIRGGAYQREIERRSATAKVFTQPCSLFVALAEEGWTHGAITESIASRYLRSLFERNDRIDTLLLGCTHFPVLADALRAVIPADVSIVDSALTTAASLYAHLAEQDLAQNRTVRGRVRLLATDSPERFARIGSLFLSEAVAAADVELVDLSQSAISVPMP